MSSSPPEAQVPPPSGIFSLATAPTRLLGRFRADLEETLAADAIRFGGAASRFFALLALLAVAYPLAAAIVHANSPSTLGGTTLTNALRPFYEVVYTESLPFMIAAAGIGFFSPALGVLLVLVFIPTDLLAASTTTAELTTMYWQIPPGPFVARLGSYLLLWILAVEIPTRVRLFADWATRGGSSSMALGAAQLGGAAAAVYLWAVTIPWLVKPVFTWSALQVVNRIATDATWYHWPILVIGVALLAGLAAIWPRAVVRDEVSESAESEGRRPARSMAREVILQLAVVLALALLFGGLMTTPIEALVLIAGLVAAGPILTILLPRIPVPDRLAAASPAVRWAVGMVVALAVAWVILTLAGKNLFTTDYFVLAVTLAIVVPMFRIILEAGADRFEAEEAADTDVSGAGAIVRTMILLVASVGWLALPAVVLADDCSDSSASELPSCDDAGVTAAVGMGGGALAAAGAGMAARTARRRRAQGKPKFIDVKRRPKSKPKPRRVPKKKAEPAPEPEPTPPQPTPYPRGPRPPTPKLPDFKDPPPDGELPGKPGDFFG